MELLTSISLTLDDPYDLLLRRKTQSCLLKMKSVGDAQTFIDKYNGCKTGMEGNGAAQMEVKYAKNQKFVSNKEQVLKSNVLTITNLKHGISLERLKKHIKNHCAK